MTTDNDQAAVDALCMLTYTSDQEGEPHDCVEGADAARAILDAIRKGEVPGVYDRLAMRDAHNAADYNRRCWEGVSADRDAEKARADKATAERDRLAGMLREIRASGIVSAAVDLRRRIDAALAEVGK